MIDKKLIRLNTMLVWLAFTLFTFNTNGELVGLPRFITTARLGIIFLVVALSVLLLNRGKIVYRNMFNNQFKIVVLLHFIVVFFGMVGFLLSNNILEKGSMSYLVSWILIDFVFVISFILINYIDKKLFLQLMYFSSIIFLFTIFSLVIYNYGLSGYKIYIYRNFLNENLPGGLNRFFNGVFLYVSILLAISIYGFKLKVSIRAIAIIGSLTSILLGIYSGSRQFIGAIIIFLIIFGIYSFYLSRNKIVNIARKLLIGLGIFLLVLLFPQIYTGTDTLSIVHGRFFETSTVQLESGYGRTERYVEQLNCISENLMFGLGPMGFFSKTGDFPDSGFLGFAVDYGVIPLLVMILGVIHILHRMWKSRKINLQSGSESENLFYSFLFFSFIVVFFWLNIWNELLKEYFLWMMLSLMISSRPIRSKPFFKKYIVGTLNTD